MIENKVLFERMAAEWVKEFMFNQKSFTVEDVLSAMPLKHLGIDFDKLEFGDKQKDEVWDVVENCIKTYAPRFGYKNNGHNVWKQSNAKPEPSFEFNEEKSCDASITVNPDENWDDCDGVIPEPEIETEFELCSPFNNYVKKLKAILGADPDVTVLSDEKEKVINICVAGCDKPNAYRIFFPGTINVVGSVGEVTILVNGHKKSYKTHGNFSVLQNMFSGHPLVKEVKITHFPDGDDDRLFVIFKNTTVQFKNDNFGSIEGVTTTTPELLAKEVLKGSNMVIWWSTESDIETEISK